MLAIGAFSAVAHGCIAAVMQATIAPGYQGRVFTLLMSLAAAMTPIGLILATPLTDALGVRSWYLAGGLVCAAMGAAAFLVRAIVRIESRGADAAPGTNQSSSGGDRTGRGSGTSAGSPTCPRIRVMTAPPCVRSRRSTSGSTAASTSSASSDVRRPPQPLRRIRLETTENSAGGEDRTLTELVAPQDFKSVRGQTRAAR
jgi:hypothetical protein